MDGRTDGWMDEWMAFETKRNKTKQTEADKNKIHRWTLLNDYENIKNLKSQLGINEV